MLAADGVSTMCWHCSCLDRRDPVFGLGDLLSAHVAVTHLRCRNQVVNDTPRACAELPIPIKNKESHFLSHRWRAVVSSDVDNSAQELVHRFEIADSE